jgi:5-methylthioadenosine/S-adenosylhomocysteine deaminase
MPDAPGDLLWWAPHALPITAPAAKDVLVRVEQGRITELRARVSREEAAGLGAVLHDGCVIAPGFVNAHAHLEYAAYDALTDGLDFVGWISDHVRRKRRLKPEHVDAGITCVGDATYDGAAARAMHAVGLRGRTYLEVFGGATERDAAESVQAAQRRLAELPLTELIGHGLSPHAPYTVAPALYAAVAASELPWMTHLAESPAELEFARSGGGVLADSLRAAGVAVPEWSDAPLAQLAQHLGEDVVLVHLCQASGADLERIADSGAGVAHCPRSNARLGCGRFDLAAAQRAGLVVGLGTDSPASAGPIDPFAEMRSALEQHRGSGHDAGWPSLATLLRCATLDAARVLGYADLGSLDVGAHADLVAVHVGPCADPLAAYVLGATPADVQHVAVAGNSRPVRDMTALHEARDGARDARTLLALPV